MPELTEANVRHLLRRTELVDRQARVTELLALASFDAAVDDVLDTTADPATHVFVTDDNQARITALTHFWLDQMAHDAPRPMRERMALFWHGHYCSGLEKVVTAQEMREQIDLFRTDGLGNVRQLTKDMSTQVAMIRYLDNNRNHTVSPNQNFARELMELFLLGVGNYTEDDVEANTAAWTGHAEQWDDFADPYRWKLDWHDGSVKQLLGRTINDGGDPELHAYETIDVILGDGIVPDGATNAANRGRPTREVAAELLSRKLWASFAGPPIPPAVLELLRDALLAADFDVVPWVRAMLLSEEFYADDVKHGLVRTPVEYLVAVLYATGKTSVVASPLSWMAAMGQRLFVPPDVSGWKSNAYWINAGAWEYRGRAARYVFNKATVGFYSDPDDVAGISLRNGTLLRSAVHEVVDGVRVLSDDDYVDQLLALMDLRLSPAARAEIVAMSAASPVTHRVDALQVILSAPELHLA